jgi:hypothetical protein
MSNLLWHSPLGPCDRIDLNQHDDLDLTEASPFSRIDWTEPEKCDDGGMKEMACIRD